MAFPFETEDDIEIEESVEVPKEYGIDFTTGEPNGTIVEGNDAIKVWIYLALNTPRYRHLIYSWDYGHELDDLKGKTYTQEYIECEAKRSVEECLSVNKYITSISDFTVSINGDNLDINFTANTLYGEVEYSV